MPGSRLVTLLGVWIAITVLAGCSPGPEGPRALVVVVVDTLRADRLFDPSVPRWRRAALAPWLERARAYDRAFASSPWTLPSFVSLYTGQIPSRHGAGHVLKREGKRNFTAVTTPADGGVHTLAERLRQAGFATGAVVGNAALSPDFGVDQGFQVYDYAPATNAVIRRAGEVVDRALDFVDRQGERPFFLLVHFFDPHMDYDPPPETRGRFTAKLRSTRTLPIRGALRLSRRPNEVSLPDRRFIAAAYDEEVAYVDGQLARLLGELERRGVLDDGLVALTSDHGEELFEHGRFEHGHALWQQLVHIPLAFLGQGVVPGRDPSPVSLVDLAPTLLEAVGEPPPTEADGVSLLANLRQSLPLRTRPIFLEGILYGPDVKGVIEWPYKLIWWPGTGAHRLYDLAEDPKERRPIRDEPQTNERLLRLLRETTERAAASRGDAASSELTGETLEALKALGYVEPDDSAPLE